MSEEQMQFKVESALYSAKPHADSMDSYDHKIATIAFFAVCDELVKLGCITKAQHLELLK